MNFKVRRVYIKVCLISYLARDRRMKTAVRTESKVYEEHVSLVPNSVSEHC